VGTPGKIDHDITKVVSGIATTALAPRASANEAAALVGATRETTSRRHVRLPAAGNLAVDRSLRAALRLLSREGEAASTPLVADS